MSANENAEPLKHKRTRVTKRPSTKVKITCELCSSTREVYPSYVKRGRMKRCSRECFNISRRKHESVEFDGDVFVRNVYGYYFSKRTRRMLHRVIWEKQHGPIPEGHRIYFKDANRDNLSVNNLYLKGKNSQNVCDECDKKVRAKGKCNIHYRRMRARLRGHW